MEPLSDRDFARVIRQSPLVSIDLILKNLDGRVLVGFRINEPAKGTYFVPGGIIRKNERISSAFKRIMDAEVGFSREIEEARFLGIFEHFYSANRYGDPEYGTHYVALAYELNLRGRPDLKFDNQHSTMRWMTLSEIAVSADVHPYTKAYLGQ